MALQVGDNPIPVEQRVIDVKQEHDRSTLRHLTSSLGLAGAQTANLMPEEPPLTVNITRPSPEAPGSTGREFLSLLPDMRTLRHTVVKLCAGCR
jgi:hypothetical protein